MLVRILIFLSFFVTAHVCCAMEQAVPPTPHLSGKSTITNSLVELPYQPSTRWLINRYGKLFSDHLRYFTVRHADRGCGIEPIIHSVAITPDGSKVITGLR